MAKIKELREDVTKLIAAVDRLTAKVNQPAPVPPNDDAEIDQLRSEVQSAIQRADQATGENSSGNASSGAQDSQGAGTAGTAVGATGTAIGPDSFRAGA